MYLEHINGPEDVKKVPREALQTLADEMRAALIYKLSETGGHVGSNLGVVELTVALHYVFDSPRDKIVWDVSHQCYPHKILTGRRAAYTDPAQFGSVTGFTNPAESAHDWFTVGHTATSVSLALGLAAERDTRGGTENVIAVIGDGALGGGEAYEGLNTAGEYGKNLIVILNDNDQSVAENHGGLYRALRELRESGGKSGRNLFRGLCLNMNDGVLQHHAHTPENVVALCRALGADQITFRALWSPDADTEQGRWIARHVTAVTADFVQALKEDVKKHGKYLDTLEYGADRYDYFDFSVVIDEDSMSQAQNKTAVKYLILRPNGHLYSKWDSRASLIF